MTCTDVMDSILIDKMMPGHTKFHPDVVARHIAGRYNASDAFNHAHLQEHIRPYLTSTAYDGSLLESWKAGSSEIFNAVDNLMSYRSFLLFGDDGEVDGGPGVPFPVNIKHFPDTGAYYGISAVDLAMEKLAQRSLVRKVLSAALRGTFKGICSHGPLCGSGGNRRRVCCRMRSLLLGRYACS